MKRKTSDMGELLKPFLVFPPFLPSSFIAILSPLELNFSYSKLLVCVLSDHSRKGAKATSSCCHEAIYKFIRYFDSVGILPFFTFL